MSAQLRALTIQNGTTQRIAAGSFLDPGAGLSSVAVTMGVGFDAAGGALTIGTNSASIALDTGATGAKSIAVGGANASSVSIQSNGASSSVTLAATGASATMSLDATTTIDIGATTATVVNVGRAGQTVNFPGIVNFNGTSASPDVTFNGDVTIGTNPYDGDTLQINSAIINNAGWSANDTLVFLSTQAHNIRIDTNASGVGHALSISAGSSSNATSVGGALSLRAGAGNTTGNGGIASLIGGVAGATGVGGGANVTGGQSATGDGGGVTVAGGSATVEGNGGIVSIQGGDAFTATSKTSGSVTVNAGGGCGAGSVIYGYVSLGDTTTSSVKLGDGVSNDVQVHPGTSGNSGVFQVYAASMDFIQGANYRIRVTPQGTTNTIGNQLSILAGDGNGTAKGGPLYLSGGNATAATADGGNSNLIGGDAMTSGTGGAINIQGGTSPAAVGGSVGINGGSGGNQDGNVLVGASSTYNVSINAENITYLQYAGNDAMQIKANPDGDVGTFPRILEIESGSIVRAVSGGMIDLPQNFEIFASPTAYANPGTNDGVHGQVTAANLNILTAGSASNASALHTHTGISGAINVILPPITAGEAIVAVGSPIFVAGPTTAGFNVNETSAGPGTSRGTAAGNVIGLAATVPATNVAGQPFTVMVAGEVTVPFTTVAPATGGGWVTQPVAADVGNVVYASKTSGKLTMDVSTGAGYGTYDVVQKVGILYSSDGADANVVLVQVGDVTIL